MQPLSPSQVNRGPLYEGAFAYDPPVYTDPGGGPPYPSVDAGELAPRAGAMPGQSGIGAGRFGWFNPVTGLVLNTRTTDADALGVTIPRAVNWESCYWSRGSRWLRAGYQMTLITRGAFWLRFPGGAFRGDPVYASLVDGTAVSGDTVTESVELTKFFVTRGCTPGSLAQISTWANFT